VEQFHTPKKHVLQNFAIPDLIFRSQFDPHRIAIRICWPVAGRQARNPEGREMVPATNGFRPDGYCGNMV